MKLCLDVVGMFVLLSGVVHLNGLNDRADGPPNR